MDEKKSELDVPRIMAEIRARVKADVEASRDRGCEFRPAPAELNRGADRKAGELVHSEELYYLNCNYAYARLNLDSIKTHRKGLLGKLIVKTKRKLLSVVWEHLLKDYFEAERQYQAQLVRFLNDTSKYVDARDASNFWELIRKIDYDVTKALERIERIGDEQSAARRSSERGLHDALDAALKDVQKNLARLNAAAAQFEDRIKRQESVAAGLERITARMSRPAAGEGRTPASSAPQVDCSYHLFENRFRGSQEDAVAHMRLYLPLLEPVRHLGAVVEIGPGRGELLSLLRKAGFRAQGVDSDAAMVEEARSQGLEVQLGDGGEYLRSLAHGSLAGIVAIQVIEHLPPETLMSFVELCREKLAQGGRLVLETVNPQSLLALSSNYFRDPTHKAPLHPDTLGHIVTLAGFRVVETRYLSPVPPEGQLRELEPDEYMPPRWALALELLNHNVRRLNQLLFGFQDYCIVAEAC